MIKKGIIGIIALLLFVTNIAFTQHPQEKRIRILQQYKKLEMLRILDLSDQEEEQVLPLINEINEKRESNFNKQRRLVHIIEKAVKSDADEKKIAELIDTLMINQQEFGENNRKMYAKIRSFIPEKKFAKFLLFQLQFGKHLREQMEMRKTRQKPGY